MTTFLLEKDTTLRAHCTNEDQILDQLIGKNSDVTHRQGFKQEKYFLL